jgi:hypothetical protein
MANARISDNMMEELRKMRPEEIYQTICVMITQLPDSKPGDLSDTLAEAIAAGLITHAQIEKFENEI